MDKFNPDSVSQVSHKLRTPLTVITSTVNNLLDGAYGKLNDDQKIWLKKLATHTKTLENIASDILDMLKSRAGQVDVDGLNNKVPAPVAPQSAMHHIVEKMEQGKTPTILIVDDEPDILDTIEEALQMNKYKTITADNGSDAVRLALENHPDLILMDVLLKTQNGVEVCEEIKSKLSAYTPVLMVTGQNDLHDKFTGEKNAPDDLLMKPFQMEELFSRVHSMLRIKKLHDELAHTSNRKAA